MNDASTTTPPASSSSSASRDDQRPHRYTAALANEIELRWQAHWEDNQTFHAANPGEPGFDPSRPKFFCLDMFPYPSGAGLHVGHPEGYTATDIVSRYKRMKGFNVLHTMGWDAFGLPAEQYAIQTGVHPVVTTRSAIDTFRRQLKRFGFSYDWQREFATIDPDYYRWTQWIWLQAYHAWYDALAGRARPIDELIAELENGRAYIGPSVELVRGGVAGSIEAIGGRPIGLRKWHEVAADEQRAVLDGQRLAYLDEQTVNWCPKLGTVLANEEVIDGKSERGGYPVFRRPLKQWMFRITAYAERLLRDLDAVKWPESTRTQQAEWIGRSEGAEIQFPVASGSAEGSESITVFTTRPDTIFGATFMVIAPEHPLIEEILRDPPPPPPPEADTALLRSYIDAARHRSDVDRMAETKDKTGVFTGIYAVNPATGKPIPVWTADYVLMGYGTGAIMAVPGQDQRDWEFAAKFNLPIVRTVQPPAGFEGEAYLGDGPAINSANDEVSLDGLHIADAKLRIIEWLETSGRGRRKINYKLRDWLFSRQRYWGEPFPIVYDEQGNHYPIDEVNLPVELPELADYTPIESDDPQPLLAKATQWVNTTAGEAGVSPDVLPPATPVRRETNTMPGWAGSCWYELRFCEPRNDDRFVGVEAERYWMLSRRDGAGSAPGLSPLGSDSQGFDPRVHHSGGVDLYIGGSEHAVLHLLYARFWHKILFDLGHVSTPEPFGRLFHQGMITSFAYQRGDKSLVAADHVDEISEGTFIERSTGQRVTQVVAKMSKSLKNVINPDDVIAEYGADTFRLYEMYMGPLDASKPWNPRDIVGCFRFLQRAWRMAVDERTGELRLCDSPDIEIEKSLHRATAKVEQDIERLSFNTAIAELIKFVNLATEKGGEAVAATAAGALTANQLERFVLILSPFAPHMAEELWYKLGKSESLAWAAWPEVEPSMLVDERIELPVQILGKLRGKVAVPSDADAGTVESIVLADETIKPLLAGKTVRKVIVVPGKIVNIVAN
jgi:leucyl-tRNA synthetase